MTNLPPTVEIVKPLTNPMVGRERPIGDVMRAAQRRLVSHLDTALHETGYSDVGAAHASVLGTIDARGSRLATLAERGGRTKQAVAELAGHLVARGYVSLAPDPSDGRAKLYLLTERGFALLVACGRIVDEYESWLDGVLGADGVAQLRHALVAIIEHDEAEPTG